MKNTPKHKQTFLSFYDMFSSFENYENYLDREEEPTLDFLDGLIMLDGFEKVHILFLGIDSKRQN